MTINRKYTILTAGKALNIHWNGEGDAKKLTYQNLEIILNVWQHFKTSLPFIYSVIDSTPTYRALIILVTVNHHRLSKKKHIRMHTHQDVCSLGKILSWLMSLKLFLSQWTQDNLLCTRWFYQSWKAAIHEQKEERSPVVSRQKHLLIKPKLLFF